MAGRKRIGLTYSYDEQWIAGTYYIMNIVHGLNCLADDIKPVVVVLTENRKNYILLKEQTQYPYLEFFELPIKAPLYSPLERTINKLAWILAKAKWIRKKPRRAKVDLIYPFELEKVSEKPISRVNWVPDFQEVYLPELFPKEELERRRRHQENTICKGDWVVFSSEDSRKDFRLLFPRATVKQYVLPFAVTHPQYNDLSINILLTKYELPEAYFFAPNQFWAHKNHLVIIEALNHLKKKGIECCVAFSGRELDHRNQAYVEKLKAKIADYNLEDAIRFLGFIPRKDQLKLMSESIAIVQPSKFEGWSTVVEDAKALGHFIICSSIKVHREQIEQNCSFFEPDDFLTLAEIMKKGLESGFKTQPIDYNKQRLNFALRFLDFVDQASK